MAAITFQRGLLDRLADRRRSRGESYVAGGVALNVALEDFEAERVRLEGLGLKINATAHEWLHVRSLYFADPEGNTLEFVSYDETVQ